MNNLITQQEATLWIPFLYTVSHKLFTLKHNLIWNKTSVETSGGCQSEHIDCGQKQISLYLLWIIEANIIVASGKK